MLCTFRFLSVNGNFHTPSFYFKRKNNAPLVNPTPSTAANIHLPRCNTAQYFTATYCHETSFKHLFMRICLIGHCCKQCNHYPPKYPSRKRATRLSPVSRSDAKSQEKWNHCSRATHLNYKSAAAAVKLLRAPLLAAGMPKACKGILFDNSEILSKNAMVIKALYRFTIY